MKRLITLFASLLVLCCGAALAQEYVPTPVTVSKEKVKLNGKVYLSHVVLERQTLYSISKAYGVSEEDLYEANPSLRETGLQKNAILLIPYRENAVTATDNAAPKAQEGSSYTEHTVKWYEDIDDIARRYDLTVKEIMDINGLKSKKLTREAAKVKLHEWYQAIADCTLREVKSARDAIKDREECVLNYFINHATNAAAESLNSKLKGFRAQVRGVSDLPFFMYRVCQIFG